MKKSITTALWLLVVFAARGQNVEEWFAQKETQLRYLRESLAALAAYAAQVQKGYDIAHAGLSTIKGIREGDLWLHQDHIASLGHVSPPVKDYGRALAPEAILSDLRAVCHRLLRALEQSGQLTAPELRSHQRICAALLEEAGGILAAIQVLSREGEAELADNVRIRRLGVLCGQLRERYAFARELAASSLGLALQRYAERRELSTLHRYYDTEPSH